MPSNRITITILIRITTFTPCSKESRKEENYKSNRTSSLTVRWERRSSTGDGKGGDLDGERGEPNGGRTDGETGTEGCKTGEGRTGTRAGEGDGRTTGTRRGPGGLPSEAGARSQAALGGEKTWGGGKTDGRAHHGPLQAPDPTPKQCPPGRLEMPRRHTEGWRAAGGPSRPADRPCGGVRASGEGQARGRQANPEGTSQKWTSSGK